jgi:riboflavin biosynthesis pyrimidine reductase
MSEDILELYPATGEQHTLEGLYLSQNIRQQTGKDDVFIYSNFITSIDGRIGLPVAGKKTRQVPAATGNPRDWRLYQELAAQADLLITSARYFRQSDNSEAQDQLPVGPSGEFDDLREWRLKHGLKQQPDIAILSASLDIPVNAVQTYQHRKVTIFTGQQADKGRLNTLLNNTHAEIVFCGTDRYVDGSQIRNQIKAQGYQFVYAIAGPSVHHTLAAGQALDRLYLTTAQKILGGKEFDTIVWGDIFELAPTLSLTSLYLDPLALSGSGQMLAAYDIK